jgi:hypothetical protein
MKISRNSISSTAFLLILFSSCTKDATNIRLPDFNQTLVINSFIAADMAVSDVTVSPPNRVYGDLSVVESPGNLTGFISDGTERFELAVTETDTFLKIYKLSSSDIIIKDGNTYYLSVSSDKGLTAEAFCTVPLKRDIKIEVDTVQELTYNDYFGRLASISFKISITDWPGENNYYRMLCYYQSYGNPVYDYSSGKTDMPDIMYNDKGRDGEKLLLRTLEPVGIPLDAPYRPDSAFLMIYLLNTDKEYNDFHQSLLNYSSGDQPFTEPSTVYSNVTGGLGIFAAYTIDSLAFRIK